MTSICSTCHCSFWQSGRPGRAVAWARDGSHGGARLSALEPRQKAHESLGRRHHQPVRAVQSLLMGASLTVLGIGHRVLIPAPSPRHRGYFVDLFVRVSNSSAIAMYKSFGYVVYRRVLGYYSGQEDAFGESVVRQESTVERRGISPILKVSSPPHPLQTCANRCPETRRNGPWCRCRGLCGPKS